jgi:hypothetical protein
VPEHGPTHADRLTTYQRARAAEKAVREDAVRVVARWNAALAAGRARVVADDPVRDHRRHTVA